MNSSADAKVSRWNIRLNLELLYILLKKWTWLTIIIVAVLSGLSAYNLTSEYELTPAETAIAIIGNIAAYAYLKITLLIITYPFFNKLAFEGSLFILALLTALLLVIAVGSLSILAAPRMDDFPTAELIWILPLVFAIGSIFLFAVFHLSHRMYTPK